MNVTRSSKAAVLALARERPEFGKVRAARELHSRGVRVSPSSVHLIWKRHGLASTYQRLMLRRRESDKVLSDLQRSLLQRMRVSRRVTIRREALIYAAARVLGEKGYER